MRWRRQRSWTLAGAGLVTAGVAGALFWTRTGRVDEASHPVTRTSVTFSADQELTSEARAQPLALSPDGSRLVYVAYRDGRTQLYLRQLDAFEAKPMAGTEGAWYPFFSPDGESVGFFATGSSSAYRSMEDRPCRCATCQPSDAVARGGRTEQSCSIQASLA